MDGLRHTLSLGLLAASAPVLLALAGCGPEEPPPPDPERVHAEALASFESALARVVRRVENLASSANRTLDPLPLITPGDEAALRAYLNDVHVARALLLGVRALNGPVIDSLVAAGRLVDLEDSTTHWIVRPRTAPAQVTPDTRALLEELGSRFQSRLVAMGLPAFRLEVTSALRTSERQEALRRTNANAAAGLSSHEFGTTVDVSYAAFAPPAELPAELWGDAPESLRPHLRRFADLALESVSARKSRELTAILGEVLREAQAEGLVLVIYERQQSVFHLTVARAMVADG